MYIVTDIWYSDRFRDTTVYLRSIENERIRQAVTFPGTIPSNGVKIGSVIPDTGLDHLFGK